MSKYCHMYAGCQFFDGGRLGGCSKFDECFRIVPEADKKRMAAGCWTGGKTSLEADGSIKVHPTEKEFVSAYPPELKKQDAGKPRYSLLPSAALREVVHVLTFGARKYPPHNWARGAQYSRYYDALQRHATSWWGGEDADPETGRSHLAHAICCLLFLLAYTIDRRYVHFDDRPHKILEAWDKGDAGTPQSEAPHQC